MSGGVGVHRKLCLQKQWEECVSPQSTAVVVRMWFCTSSISITGELSEMQILAAPQTH